jgi:hypothetical protein
MMIIPSFLLYKIQKYLSCREREIFNIFLKISGKNIDIMNIDKCKIIKYKYDHRLNCCKIHGNDCIIDAIKNLNEATKQDNCTTIHFKNHTTLKIAEPYLNHFGQISHYCCSCTGVMYKNQNDKIKDLFYHY